MVEDDIISAGRERKQAPIRQRTNFLLALLVVAIGLILGRSFYLQIVQGSELALQAEENRVAIIPQMAPRGIIYDANGEQLLQNVASTDVRLDPNNLPAVENEAVLFDELPKYLKVSPEELRGKVSAARSSGQAVILASALTHEDKIALESVLDSLPGVDLVSTSVRSYLHPEAVAAVIGYTGSASREELAAREELLPTDITGKAGLEKVYDTRLRGRHGASYREVDAGGKTQKNLGEKLPVPGQDMHLSLDIGLQEHIYNLFNEREAEREENGPPVRGAAIVLEASTGRVKALVSYPSFDPNVFSQPRLHEKAQAILNDEARPLFNLAVSGMYPPGSTIKPLIAAAALEEGLIKSETTFFSSGGIRIGQWNFPDWKAGGHGVTNVSKALAESVNTFFYLLTGGDETRAGLGAEKIGEYLKLFAWGQATGIDLPGEATGLLPTPALKEELKNEPWYIGDTYHLGIGQGDVLVTPLQVAVATAVIANNGQVIKPSLDNQVPASNRLPISTANLEVVRAGMRAAVTDGSARSMFSLPVAVAAKTGTAQVGGSEDTHAWLTSFGPADDPEIVVTVLLEKGGQGDKDAAPFARDIWQWWAENR